MTSARSTQISLSDTPYYHCMSRCVRRAFLCGKDEQTGQNYEHRKQWIVDRLKELSSIFAIDIAAYAVMSNHYHVVLYIDAKRVESWADNEIIRRWGKLFNGHLLTTRLLKGEHMTHAEKRRAREMVATWRQRLMDTSWYIRSLNETISRQANAEDNCTGRFWEGRYKSQALLDETALIACMIYVDLNPVRAAIAPSLDKSTNTSIYERIKCIKKAGQSISKSKQGARYQSPKAGRVPQPKYLLPFIGHPGKSKESKRGILIPVIDYLELADWTGREIREDKRGAIPAHIEPLLNNLGVIDANWVDNIVEFGDRFKIAAGSADKMLIHGAKENKRWMQGMAASRKMYREVE